MNPQPLGRALCSATNVLLPVLVLGILAGIGSAADVPRIWDQKQLADWSTQIAGLAAPPTYYSVREYYDAPLDNLRTYPVYYPGREPEGYWESLQKKSPEPLIDLQKTRTPAEWIASGQRIFDELDASTTRVWDPKLIALARSEESLDRMGAKAEKDGTLFGFRWVVTEKGIALSLSDCSLCHTQLLENGTIIAGAPINRPVVPLLSLQLIMASFQASFPGSNPLYTQFGVPWVQSDIHDHLKTMTRPDLVELFGGHPGGVFARPNGSPFYPSKVPDLIGIGERKWLEHTGTHRIRGPEDIMRYVALVTCCDPMDFGSYHMLTAPQRHIQSRLPDELLYALVQYLYSLQPPPNPNHFDAHAAAGQKIFVRETCSGCHTPPLYTNNKLTLASGFVPPQDGPRIPELLDISVGTDPNMALKTRKGTGYYKIPSLKGVWYRRLYLHDGSVASLEDMFDPARVRDDYVPTGFKGFQTPHHAVVGHKFGLQVSPQEKADLLAFLRTL